MEALVIHKTIQDLEDLMDPIRKVTVKLMECGTKLLVEEPSVPHYFHTQPDEMFESFENAEICRAIQTAHEYKMTSIRSVTSRHTKTYILNIPDGLKCKMGYTNPMNACRVLNGTMSWAVKTFPNNMTGAGIDLEFRMVTVTYVIAIETEEQKIIRNPSGTAEVTKFFKRMSTVQKNSGINP